VAVLSGDRWNRRADVMEHFQLQRRPEILKGREELDGADWPSVGKLFVCIEFFDQKKKKKRMIFDGISEGSTKQCAGESSNARLFHFTNCRWENRNID
jgi:hypothetical protein